MSEIDENIYKRITRTGHVDREAVPNKARVSVRYSGYWEGETAPFDSSLLRGSKFVFETGQGTVVEGLEVAVRSMRPYEQAEFISPTSCFSENSVALRGSSPRRMRSLKWR